MSDERDDLAPETWMAEPHGGPFGAVMPPIYQSSLFTFDSIVFVLNGTATWQGGGIHLDNTAQFQVLASGTLAIEVHVPQCDVLTALAVEDITGAVDADAVEGHVGHAVHVDVVGELPADEGDRCAGVVLPVAG